MDPDKQKELQIQDEEEDYLDEASIYTYGSNCPMPLRLIACVLLQEITAFLRETYQNLPKSSRVGGKKLAYLDDIWMILFGMLSISICVLQAKKDRHHGKNFTVKKQTVDGAWRCLQWGIRKLPHKVYKVLPEIEMLVRAVFLKQLTLFFQMQKLKEETIRLFNHCIFD